MDKTTALASEAIPPHLQPHARRIREAGKRTLNAACKLGQELCDAREAAQHGEWLPFLAALGIPETSARRYMMVAAALAERPDAAREPLTTIRAVLEGPPAAGGPDGERQIRHVADWALPAEVDVVDADLGVCAAEKIGPNMKWTRTLMATTCSSRSCRKSSHGADS